MKVEIILAMDAGCGIGFEGRLPWPHCPKDMKRFQDITTSEDDSTVIVMGRHTHSDILAAAKERKRKNKDIKKNGILKGRKSIVLSSTEDEFHGAVGMKSLRDVFNEYQFTDKRIIVIGGAKLFIEAMAWASVAHVTLIDKHFKCDRSLPANLFKDTEWVCTPNEKVELGDDTNAYFVTFYRREHIMFGDGNVHRGFFGHL